MHILKSQHSASVREMRGAEMPWRVLFAQYIGSNAESAFQQYLFVSFSDHSSCHQSCFYIWGMIVITFQGNHIICSSSSI
jgi:hypothetical protein